MVVVVIVIMTMAMIMIMMIVVVAGFEELRLDLEDAIEIEGAAMQHFGHRAPCSARCGAACA